MRAAFVLLLTAALFLGSIPSAVALNMVSIPYLQLHCTFNTTYLDNFCTGYRCGPNVVYGQGGVFTFLYYGAPLNDSYWSTFRNACAEDISPVINRIKQDNFSRGCDAYHDGNKTIDNAESLGGGWYLQCRSYTPSGGTDAIGGMGWIGLVFVGILGVPLLLFIGVASLFRPYLVSVMLMLLFLIALGYFLKRRNKLICALPVFFGFVGGFAAYAMSTDKRVGLKLLLLGIAITLILVGMVSV